MPCDWACSSPRQKRRSRRQPATARLNSGRKFLLYEFKNPNVGHYSPTSAIKVLSAPKMIDRMSEDDFDFARTVLVQEDINVPLVKASRSRMDVIRGGVRVRGSSSGTSILLLPMQYSHCLALESNGDARLIRADFLFAGLVFSGNIEAKIKLSLSPLNPRCHSADKADLANLGVKAQNRVTHDYESPHALTLLQVYKIFTDRIRRFLF